MDSTPSRALRVLITGATGFVGSELLRYLVNDSLGPCEFIYIVVRDHGEQSALSRFAQLQQYWQRHVGFNKVNLKRVILISADLIDTDLSMLPAHVDIVFHCAASTDFAASITQSRRANVLATRHLLEYYAASPGPKPRFVYFSTAYVSNVLNGEIDESCEIRKFYNNYEQSKYEAEQIVKVSGLDFVILRPTIIVGDSETGYVKGFKVLYSLMRIWLTGRLSRVPLDKRALIDIVPIDYVVRAAWALGLSRKAHNQVVHLSAGRRACSPVALMNVAFAEFNLPKPKFLLFIVARIIALAWLQPFIGHRLRGIVDIAKWHLPYLGKRGRIFANERAQSLLAEHGISYPATDAFHHRIFEFCRVTNWGKKSRCLT